MRFASFILSFLLTLSVLCLICRGEMGNKVENERRENER